MSYFKVCEHCGAHLDPQEECDCQKGEETCSQQNTSDIYQVRNGNEKKLSGWKLMDIAV